MVVGDGPMRAEASEQLVTDLGAPVQLVGDRDDVAP